MDRKAFAITGAAAALALSGCDQKVDSQVAAADNGMSNASEAAGNILSNAASSVKESVLPVPTGQEFADEAAKSDAFEIASAKLAEHQASSSEIKHFAAMMIEDHTASTAKIKKAAGAASPAITPDPALTSDQADEIAKLKTLTGPAFDKEYASQQVDAHEAALSLMDRYADKGEVGSLKTAAGDIKPKVQAHLDKIKTIKDSLG